MLANFKNYGFYKIRDDKFLTTCGALGSLTNGVFRIGWGILMDKFSFRCIATFNIIA